jgi:CHASE2 domain-containing sensor protein
LIVVWLVEVAVFVVPTGMVSVLNGSIDDGWNGVLGWFWLACASSTGVLAWFTRAALRERSYSAVMAATGLSYLAILTGFGTDLIARALLMA